MSKLSPKSTPGGGFNYVEPDDSHTTLTAIRSSSGLFYIQAENDADDETLAVSVRMSPDKAMELARWIMEKCAAPLDFFLPSGATPASLCNEALRMLEKSDAVIDPLHSLPRMPSLMDYAKGLSPEARAEYAAECAEVVRFYQASKA